MFTPTITERWRDEVGVRLRRTTGGVVEIEGDTDDDLARGLGWAHAADRQVQMVLLRLIGQGRLSEQLKADETTLEIDVFMREMGMARSALAEVGRLDEGTRGWAEAYCEGVNAYFGKVRRPLELLMVGHRPEPWRVEDILLTVQIMSYVGLAQSQEDMERLLIQALRRGVPLASLKNMFAPHLDGLDAAMVERLKGLLEVRGLLPDTIRFAPVPRMMASNNWVVAAARSTSGNALACNDPHLECNRLPAIWYEWVGRMKDDYRAGISMPGVPGLVMGRTRSLAAGFTYGFMDLIDFFVEEVKDGKVRRADGFVSIDERVERIERKGDSPVDIRVRETSHGVLEANVRKDLADGDYLCRAWSGTQGAAGSLIALRGFLSAPDVASGAKAVRDVTISANWLLADRTGRIAYQQSGRLPVRRHSGLYPVPGWDAAFAWDGIVSPEHLAHTDDPEDGILVTANQDLNRPGGPLTINLPMGSYRADRIRHLLTEAGPKLDLADMKRIQADLFSRQADEFLTAWDGLLPATPAADALRAWDRCYDAGSRGATLFERAYEAVLRAVFGEGLFGLDAWDELTAQSGIVVDFYGFFDDALRTPDGPWYGEEGRDAIVRRALADKLTDANVPTWGEVRSVSMTNVFFAGTLPSWLGFDHGPIALEGNRATVVQGALYQAHGRTTTFAPSYRFVTDLGTDEIETVLAGGPSGKRFSRWYKTDIERWLRREYKTLVVKRNAP